MTQTLSIQNEVKDVHGLTLFGMVAINKRLIFQVFHMYVI